MKTGFAGMLVVVFMLGLFGCGEESDEPSGDFKVYYYSQTDFTIETAEGAERAWVSMRDLPEVSYVAEEESYRAIVFMHPFTMGDFDPVTAEWIGIVYSVPQAGESVRIAIIRLDYESMQLKKAHKMLVSSVTPITEEEAIAIMEANRQYEQMVDWHVDPSQVKEFEGTFIYSYPPNDFGGILVVNGYTGKLVFSATSVWDGVGKVLIPGQ